MDKSDQIVEKIKELLNQNNIAYKYIEHEPTPTSVDSARVRGTNESEGVKALILKTNKTNKNFMVILPGNRRLDSKKIKKYFNEDISFEKPEIIFEKYDVKVGGVPPLGNLFNLEVLIDKNIF